MNAMWLSMWKLIFLLVFSYPQPKYRLTTIFRCLSLLSFACFVHALLFLLFILLIYRWLNVVQLDVCWACIWANLCWFQFQFSFIDFVKYTMRLNELIHPIFRVDSHSYVRLVWLVGWARMFAFITLQAVNIQCWKWARANVCRVSVPLFKVDFSSGQNISRQQQHLLKCEWIEWWIIKVSAASRVGKCVNVADWEIDRQMLSVCLVWCAYLVFFSNLNYLKKLPFSSSLFALWNFIYSEVLTFVWCGCVDVAMKSYFPF